MYARIQKRTSELLSKGNISDKPSQYVDMILFILILLNVTAVCLESVKDIGESYKDTFYAFEIFSVVIFGIEYLARIWASSEKKDTQGNVVFNGEIKNIGGRRADFVKMDFVFRKNWSGETRTLTTFIQGSYNTFDSGIVSDASLLPGALGKFELYVPQDFGSFIGYSYVIDWEEYQ